MRRTQRGKLGTSTFAIACLNLDFEVISRSSVSPIDRACAITQDPEGSPSMSFVFTGCYGVLHNPQARVTHDPDNLWGDRWFDLRPLRTEGQVEEYATIIAAIPLGIGMEFGMGNGWTMGVEASWRGTFTDYLDDISGMYADPTALTPLAEAISSQSSEAVIASINDPGTGSVGNHRYSEGGTYRGNPETNDSYGTIQFTFAKSIDTRTSFERALDHISRRR